MSVAEELQARLLDLSNDCEQTAGALDTFKDSFDAQVAAVETLIGNTVTGTDQAVIAYFQEAKDALQEAIDALAEVSSDAVEYSQRL